jgi:hypothetical protein
MSERVWLRSWDPVEMLNSLGPDASPRKLRLFAAACCRDIWSTIENSRGRNDIAQRAKELRITPNEMDSLAAEEVGFAKPDANMPPYRLNYRRLLEFVDRASGPLYFATWLRDVFGNPFHPIEIDPRWFTAEAVDLARGIYALQAFDRMPYLADALMDGGCDNDELIHHCQFTAWHVRGCWVVDAILGRE